MSLLNRLLRWYDVAARDLPWRRTKDPYRILVSEFMLQQTQVKTALPYYDAFLKRFPTVKHLARGDEDDVLNVWKGLGYYRRARYLHASARKIVSDFEGRVPDTYEDIKQLPGVGDYTAAAVLSIAYRRIYPVLDGNVARVASRLLNLDEPVDQGPAKRKITHYLKEHICTKRPGDFNQALMELGATLCSVRSPACTTCPVESFCLAKKYGRQHELPVKSGKIRVRTEKRTVVVVRRGRYVYLRRRPDDGLLARMWEFPHVEEQGERAVERIVDLIADGKKPPYVREYVGRIDHRFSHIVWRLDVVVVTLGLSDGDLDNSSNRLHTAESLGWFRPVEMDGLALPTVMQNVWAVANRPIQVTLPTSSNIE